MTSHHILPHRRQERAKGPNATLTEWHGAFIHFLQADHADTRLAVAGSELL
jgi:hypothetical protein